MFNDAAQKSSWITNFENVFFTDWTIGSLRTTINKIIDKHGVNIVQYSYIEWKKALLLRCVVGDRAKFVFYFLNHLNISGGAIKRLIKKTFCRLAFDNSYKICMTEGVADSVRNLSTDNVIVINHPVDLHRLDTIGSTSEIDDDNNTAKVFMFGNHYERKGVDIAACICFIICLF